MRKQTKDINLTSPRVEKLLQKHPEIQTIHLRRTLRNEVCLVGLNCQKINRTYLEQKNDLTESSKSLLVELGITIVDLQKLLSKIHLPWINKVFCAEFPEYKGTGWARYFTLSQGGRVEIHKKTGVKAKNDPRNFGLP